ncbi:MAG: putative porin [Prolixibacteraceae bacterium]
MRSWILTIIWCLLAELAFGQNMPLTRNQGENIATDTSADSIAKTEEPVESIIHVWTLDNQFGTKNVVAVDSSTLGFNNFNPIFQRSISNSYLGYLGSSYTSNIYFDQSSESNFYFLRNFDAYRQTQNKVRYYNSTTPYASLMYLQGGQGSTKTEQLFKAFFTSNIDSITNFGFQFNAIRAPGQYLMQEARHKFLNFFVSRNGTRLNSYFNFINGSDEITESGGISDSSLDQFTYSRIVYTNLSIPSRVDPTELGAKLTNEISNTSKSFSIFTSHEYLMGQIPFLLPKKIADSTFVVTTVIDSVSVDSIVTVSADVQFTPKYSIQYSAEFENHQRRLLESTVDNNFFTNTYINTKSHTDSVFFSRFSHILQIKAFENDNRKYTFGTRAFIENEIVTAQHPLPDGMRKYNYSNVNVGGELYRRNSSFLNWSAIAQFTLLGRNIGDAIVKGKALKPLVFGADTTSLLVEAWYQDQSADIFQEHWYSNHYKWENQFKKQHEVVLKGQYSYPRFSANAGVNYALLSNFIYNNEAALPAQYESAFSILSAWVNKDITVGRLGWSNKIVWQELSNDAVLRLPVWNFYSSIYYSHYLFKVMKIQMGVEVYFNSKFLANQYNPATSSFYLQEKDTQLQMDPSTYKYSRYENNLIGGYPLINLYVNAKLKRTSAFAELYHANSMFPMGDFYSSQGYPLDQMAFRFGFFWTFYD